MVARPDSVLPEVGPDHRTRHGRGRPATAARGNAGDVRLGARPGRAGAVGSGVCRPGVGRSAALVALLGRLLSLPLELGGDPGGRRSPDPLVVQPGGRLAAGPVGGRQLALAGTARRGAGGAGDVVGALGQLLGPLGGLLLEHGLSQGGVAGGPAGCQPTPRGEGVDRGRLGLAPGRGGGLGGLGGRGAGPGRLLDRQRLGAGGHRDGTGDRRVRGPRCRARPARGRATHGAPRARCQPRWPGGPAWPAAMPRKTSSSFVPHGRVASAVVPKTVGRAGTRPGPSGPDPASGGGRLQILHLPLSTSDPTVVGPDGDEQCEKDNKQVTQAQSAGPTIGQDGRAASILGRTRGFRGLEWVKFGQC